MELTSPRFAELLELTDRYNRIMGGYEAADLLAAGFSPAEIDAFETHSQLNQPLSAPPIDPSAQTFLRDRDPTLRERHTAALARLFGGDDPDRDDYRRAQKFTGTTDPTATFADQMGLFDLVAPGGVYAIEEGTDRFQRGRTTSDRGTMAGGALETGLGILGLVPGVSALVKTARSGLRRTAPAPAPAPAVIRRDDVFRGSGPARVSYTPTPDEPFAFRKTGLDQVQDMIESGLVRPKPGGFRGQKSTLYFGTSAQPDPMAGRFTAPNETQPVVLVGDAERLASFEDGIPIDALSRVLIRQPDGSTVNALPDILRQNRAFTPDS